VTNLADGIAGASAALSALQLKTSDIAYGADPLDAIAVPIAADTGLLTLAVGIEFDLAEAAISTA
jgi:hypothetical protein